MELEPAPGRAPAARSIRDRPDAHWLAVAAVCIGALMGQLDASIVTVALPTLQRSFHASVGSVTWVDSATCWCWWPPSPPWAGSPTCGAANSSTSTAS